MRWTFTRDRHTVATALGLVLLVVHVLGMALAGFTRGAGALAYLAGLAGLIAVPLCSWQLSRLLDRHADRLGRRSFFAAGLRVVLGGVSIALLPAVYNALSRAPLPLIGRALELGVAALSVAVMSGLVLLALGLADLLYLSTWRLRRLSTRLMVLLLFTSLGTFFWLSFVGLQAHDALLWAVEQGHLQAWVAWIDTLSRAASAYLGGLAGALGLELPFLMLLAWRFGRNATSGLSVLHQGFERVAAGDYDETVPVRGNDEVAAMQRGFNAMLEAARERHFLETAFGRYVSPVVLERMRREGGGGMLGGERRVATVLFSDIRGFTALSADLAPEQVIAVLNTYMSRMIDTIARYDGYINKFVGDAIMVVFNVPLDQRDHALRALACAQAMQHELERDNEGGIFGEVDRLEMGIGLNTGALVAGNLGNERQVEFTVLGDTVNVASRACNQAGKNQIVLTPSVLEALEEGPRASIAHEDLGEIEVKGKGKVHFLRLDSSSAQLDDLLFSDSTLPIAVRASPPPERDKIPA
jgi:class 3 adenylate cyclase